MLAACLAALARQARRAAVNAVNVGAQARPTLNFPGFETTTPEITGCSRRRAGRGRQNRGKSGVGKCGNTGGT